MGCGVELAQVLEAFIGHKEVLETAAARVKVAGNLTQGQWQVAQLAANLACLDVSLDRWLVGQLPGEDLDGGILTGWAEGDRMRDAVFPGETCISCRHQDRASLSVGPEFAQEFGILRLVWGIVEYDEP